jgi:acetyl esterase/lipase
MVWGNARGRAGRADPTTPETEGWTAVSNAIAVGPQPPFDAECAAVLATVPPFPPLTADTIALHRQIGEQMIPRPTDEDLARGGRFVVDERSVPGPAGAPDISLLVSRPVSPSGPTPVLYYTHGGGMMMGDNRSGLIDVMDLAEALGAAVVSVEYRLAPETPHPGPVEDCYAGLRWIAGHGDDLGIDAACIVLIGGSAGGGLAAALALLARDRGGPALAGQLLMCPMLDDRNDTPSAYQMAGQPMWNRAANDVGWTALLGAERGGPEVSRYAAPARATDLAGLPPTFIDVGSTDTFRDEDVAFASRIWQAGGVAELHVWPGGFHGFDGIAPQAALSQAAKAARLNWLRRLLA